MTDGSTKNVRIEAPRPLQILIHTPDFPLWDGGIATVAYEYAKAYTDRGHRVVVVALEMTSGDREWDLKQPFKIIRLKRRKSLFWQYLFDKSTTRKLIKRQPFDLFISLRWTVSGLIGAKMKKEFGIPLAQMFHGNEIFDKRLQRNFWSKRFAASVQLADQNMSVSQYTNDLLLSVAPHGIKTFINALGVDAEHFRPSDHVDELKDRYHVPGKKVILTLARLTERKGHSLVINALPKIAKEVPDVVYLIAGRGSYESELRSLVASLGMEDYVRFLGFVDDMQKLELYQLCDVFVMPSKTSASKGDIEGFGLTYLEANACGKPAIGARSGGVVDAITPDLNGFLIDPDSVEQLQRVVVRLLSDAQYYQACSANALSYVKTTMTWSCSAERLLQKILELNEIT